MWTNVFIQMHQIPADIPVLFAIKPDGGTVIGQLYE
jgi:hypothetical protein